MDGHSSNTGNDLRAAFIAVTTLFFAWGFVTAMIDPLIPSVRAIFSLSYTQSMRGVFESGGGGRGRCGAMSRMSDYDR